MQSFTSTCWFHRLGAALAVGLLMGVLLVLPAQGGVVDVTEVSGRGLLRDPIAFWMHGVSFGVVCALVIYNLLLFFRHGDRHFFNFALLAAAQSGCLLAYFGDGSEFLWPHGSWWADRAGMFFGALTVASGIMFFRRQAFRWAPGWDAIFRVLWFSALVLLPAALFGAYGTMAGVMAIFWGGFALLTIVVSAVALGRGQRPARFFVYAWSGYAVLSLAGLLEIFGWMPVSLGNGVVQAGLALTMVLLSFALIDKVTLTASEQASAPASGMAAQDAEDPRERETPSRTRTSSEAVAQVHASSRAKGDFLAAVSHEIRNPLTAVLGNARLLRGTPLSDEQQELVTAMEHGGAQMMTLLNELLDLSRIESGEFKLDRTVFSLRELIETTVRTTKALAAAKGLTLQYEGERLPVRVYGDPRRLRQVLLNLIGNAIKFTDRGSVSVSVEPLGEEGKSATWCFTVADSGMGIPRHKLERLFQPFSQIHAGFRDGGSGLGLAICKHLVEAMGGEIGVESMPGEGSLFWFTLTFEVADVCEEAPTIAARPPSLSLLLVEDLKASREIISKLLQREGHRVTAVASGEEAVAIALTQFFDLVLMDLRMPGIGGLEAARRIRALPEFARAMVPIFAFTANVLERTAEECRAVGIEGVILKPLDLADLNARLVARFGVGGEDDSHDVPRRRQHEVLDRPALDQRLELLGSEGLKKVLAAYAESGTAALHEIERAWARGDLRQIARLAHRMAGSADTAGLRIVGASARRIEAILVDGGAVEELPALIDSLAQAHGVGLTTLERWARERHMNYEFRSLSTDAAK